jgi:acyl-CoA dehydrogenase
MGQKRHKPEEIVAKLRQVEVLTGQGRSIAEAARSIGVSEQTYFRWRAEYGGMKVDQLKRLKSLKMFATEAAQKVIDRAVQIFGGKGVQNGVKVEELYREIRALRIYEGATEVQKVIIGRELIKTAQAVTGQ